MSELRIAGIAPESIVDGPGFRFTVFTQGCPHRCEGCHNPNTHDFSGGEVVDTDTLWERISKDILLSGVTFSGGEPFEQAGNLLDLAVFHDPDPVKNIYGTMIMCHNQHTGIMFMGNLFQKSHNFAPHAAVQCGSRFVSKQQIRHISQSSGDRHPLLLSP